jgi:hypothetical protein
MVGSAELVVVVVVVVVVVSVAAVLSRERETKLEGSSVVLLGLWFLARNIANSAECAGGEFET